MKQVFYFITLIITLLCCSCYQNKTNCANFKTGKFEFVLNQNGKQQKTIFIRNENTQIEIFNNKIDTASIRWINDCEFILKKINPKNREERKPISMKILTTTKNTYTFEYFIVGETKKQTGIVTKIN